MKNSHSNFIPYFFYWSLISLFLSCQQSESPCSGAINCNDYQGQFRGTVLLTDTNKIWLSFKDSFSKVTFKNGNGTTLVYSLSYWQSYNETPVNRYTKNEPRPCCTDKVSYYRDYINEQNELVKYEQIDGRSEFSVTRNITAAVKFNQNDSLIVTSTREDLDLVINNTWFPINMDTSYSLPEQQFHQEILLGNKTYTQVFERFYAYQSPATATKGVYFSPSKGIIGYYLANGELWLRE